ncbi:MAG: LysE family translocator [Pseudomonadota bacterium]
MFIEPSAYLAFVIASIALVVVPGPSVTVIIANSLKHGSRAGLLNVAGTQAGLAIMLLIVAIGLEAITTSLAFVFDWLRLAGAAYLVWLGYQMLRSNGELAQGGRMSMGGSFFWQGFVVIWSNPKALLFYGAFIPQFLSADGSAIWQTVFLGATFMVVATIFDSIYAVAAGRAGGLLTTRNVRTVEIAGGSLLVGGGLWLALTGSFSDAKG